MTSQQAQNAIAQTQTQLQNEYYALDKAILTLGNNAKKAESSGRASACFISFGVGAGLGFVAFAMFGMLFIGILLAIAGIGVAYAVRFAEADKKIFDTSVNNLNNYLRQNLMGKYNNPT